MAHVPLGQLADIRVMRGPGMVQSEGGRLTASVTLNIDGSDFGGYVKQAQKAIAEKVKVPAGYRIQWSGQYEYMENVKAKLLYVIPLTLLIIIVLIYLNTESWIKTAIVLLAVPFSLVGTVWLLYFLGYHMSTAVWVGVIALAGLDAETGIVMLLYLDLSYNRWHQEGRINTLQDIEGLSHGGGGEADPAEDHDRVGHPSGPRADHVLHRHGRGCDEAHCRAHGRRCGHVDHSRTHHLSGYLCDLEGTGIEKIASLMRGSLCRMSGEKSPLSGI